MMSGVFHPGRVWNDTTGKRIQAHGGSMHYDDGTFFWYGENKEKTLPASGVWHWGVRCYSSTDLYNWTDLGLIVPPVVDDPDSPLHPAQKLDRPHIIFNPNTEKYVCWVKVMGDHDVQTSTILTSDSFFGPYEILRSGVKPLGMSAGDLDLTVDLKTGKAYYYFEKVHSKLICADLTDDFTDVTGNYSSHFPHPHPPLVREAPAYFRRDSKHYLITSGTTWYFPNPSEAAIAESHHGPWRLLGNPHPADSSRTSYRSQISCVFRHPEKQDLFVAMADRWLPDLSKEQSNVTETFHRLYSGESLEHDVSAAPRSITHPDISVADYVWLPIRFEDDMPIIDWHDEWCVEQFD